MKLFLDDERDPPRDGGNWHIVRSYDEFVNYINENGIPQHISFDHDLGDGKTGYDCVKWLLTDRKLPKGFTYYVHSQNPVGRENIVGLFACYFRVNGVNS